MCASNLCWIRGDFSCLLCGWSECTWIIDCEEHVIHLRIKWITTFLRNEWITKELIQNANRQNLQIFPCLSEANRRSSKRRKYCWQELKKLCQHKDTWWLRKNLKNIWPWNVIAQWGSTMLHTCYRTNPCHTYLKNNPKNKSGKCHIWI